MGMCKDRCIDMCIDTCMGMYMDLQGDLDMVLHLHGDLGRRVYKCEKLRRPIDCGLDGASRQLSRVPQWQCILVLVVDGIKDGRRM